MSRLPRLTRLPKLARLKETHALWGLRGILQDSLINLRLWIRRRRIALSECASSFVETVKNVYREGKLIGLFWWFSPLKPLNYPDANGVMKRQMIFAVNWWIDRRLCMIILSKIKADD